MKSWVATIFIVGFLSMCESASGVGYCVVPGVPEAVDRAEALFSGKIVDLVKIRSNSSPPSSSAEYIVKFEIEHWWKGTESRELRVLWRPEIFGCAYFPVGEIGERYLVFAESPRSEIVEKDRLLEITVLNRTSKITSTTQVFSQFDSGMGGKQRSPFVHIAPDLNRNDASNDIEVLRRIKACGCLLPDILTTCMDFSKTLRPPRPEILHSSSTTGSCCTCLRRNVRSF